MLAVNVIDRRVISPDKVGCVRVYFAASVPLKVYPVVLIVIPVPTFTLAKVNTGLPPRLISSPDATPTKVAVPEEVAAVVASYTLLFPVIPVIVKTPRAVVSLAFSPMLLLL